MSSTFSSLVSICEKIDCILFYPSRKEFVVRRNSASFSLMQNLKDESQLTQTENVA